jgi:ferredoxin
MCMNCLDDCPSEHPVRYLPRPSQGGEIPLPGSRAAASSPPSRQGSSPCPSRASMARRRETGRRASSGLRALSRRRSFSPGASNAASASECARPMRFSPRGSNSAGRPSGPPPSTTASGPADASSTASPAATRAPPAQSGPYRSPRSAGRHPLKTPGRYASAWPRSTAAAACLGRREGPASSARRPARSRPKAITVEEVDQPMEGGGTVHLQRPMVDPARCIGCGVCEHECPLSGVRGIRVVADNETRQLDHAVILHHEK